MKRVYTICFLVKKDKVVLGLKKKGFLAGKLGGSGGKVEEGETIEECAIRETKEEFKVTITSMEKFGEIQFFDPDLTHECHVFLVTEWEGEIEETIEMKPDWFPINEIPFERLNRADEFWIPPILIGRKIMGKFYYEDPSDTERLTRREVVEVEGF